MANTDTTLKLPTTAYLSRDGRYMLEGFELKFNLSKEDFLLLANRILPEMQKARPDCELPDAFLAMLTYGIHKAMEDIEGVPFVLDMDRKRNQS